MDRIERLPKGHKNTRLAEFKAALDDRQSKTWTALPSFVKTFNSGAVTVEAQPTIQAQVRQPNGTWVWTTLPLCLDCPVMYPGGGNFIMTFPLAANDEGLLIFASKCIDAWWQNGGIQQQAELRMHDLSDGFFLPTGGMSQPNIPGNVNATGTELRSKDGNTVIHIDPALATMSLNNGHDIVSLATGEAKMSVGNGAAVIDINSTTNKCSITATAGLWVNGTQVTVP